MDKTNGTPQATWEAVVTAAVERGLSQERTEKQDRSRRRRVQILQAAVRVFARDGIARARITDIAAEAGVPVSSVYDYHSSKEDLAYAVPIALMGEFSLSSRSRRDLCLRLANVCTCSCG